MPINMPRHFNIISTAICLKVWKMSEDSDLPLFRTRKQFKEKIATQSIFIFTGAELYSGQRQKSEKDQAEKASLQQGICKKKKKS